MVALPGGLISSMGVLEARSAGSSDVPGRSGAAMSMKALGSLG